MKDAYVNAFHGVVKETQATTGLELPENLEAYIVMLLASNMDKPNFLPEQSFAEAYFKLRRPANYNAKQLGDACLFVSGAFPAYGQKYGLSKDYYQNIGISSYEMVAEVMNEELFTQLSLHFMLLSSFIEFVVVPEKPKDIFIKRL